MNMNDWTISPRWTKSPITNVKTTPIRHAATHVSLALQLVLWHMPLTNVKKQVGGHSIKLGTHCKPWSHCVVLHTIRTRCTVNQFSLNVRRIIVSVHTQQTLINLYWRNTKNSGSKLVVSKHAETFPHSAQISLCARAKNQQVCGEWYLNHSQMVQRMLAVPSTHTCIWYANCLQTVWFAITPFLHSLVCIVLVDKAHLINNLSMSKYKLMSSWKSGIKYDFPPLERYMFVNLPNNWKVIR